MYSEEHLSESARALRSIESLINTLIGYSGFRYRDSSAPREQILQVLEESGPELKAEYAKTLTKALVKAQAIVERL